MGINTVTLSGRVTRDPELRHLSTGTALLDFGLAHNERRKNADGEYVDVPHFFDCKVWSGFGEMLAGKLRKGDEVTIRGELQYSSWETDEGTKRSKVDITVRDLVGECMYRAKVDEAPAEAPDGQDDIPF